MSDPQLRFIMKDVEPYYPEVNGVRKVLPWQRKFHYGITPSRKGADYTLLSGGCGSGMTTAICADIAFHLDRFPGIKLAVVAPEEYLIQEFFMPVYRQTGPWNAERMRSINTRTHTLNMANESFLSMRSCKDPNILRGFEFHKAYMIEASDFDEGREVFSALAQRCRAPGDFPRCVVVQQNPRGHNWAYDVFIKPTRSDEGLLNSDGFREYEYTKTCTRQDGTIEEVATFYTLGIPAAANTFLPTLAPDYVEAMLQHFKDNPEKRKRFIDGEFLTGAETPPPEA